MDMENTPPERREFNARRIYLGVQLKDCIEDCNIRDLRVLLEAEHADPNVLLPDINYTPLHAVAGCENESFAEEAVKLLLEHEGDPNVRAEEDLTPVHVAASCGHGRVLRQLLEKGGSMYLADELGKTAFHYARDCDTTEILSILHEFSKKKFRDRKSMFSSLRDRLKNLRCDGNDGSSGGGSMNGSTKGYLPAESVTTITSFRGNKPRMKTTLLQTVNESSDALMSPDSTVEKNNSENFSVISKSSRNSSNACKSSDRSSKKNSLLYSSSLQSSNSVTSSYKERYPYVRKKSLSNEQPISSAVDPCTVPSLVSSKSLQNASQEKNESSYFDDIVPLRNESSSGTPENSSSMSFEHFVGCDIIEAQKESPVLPASRKSIARSSLMKPLRKIPDINVIEPTPPSVSQLTRELIAHHNSPINFGPVNCNERSETDIRIHQWLHNVRNNSAELQSPVSDSNFSFGNSVEKRLNKAAIGSELDSEINDASAKTSKTTLSERFRYADEKEGIVLLEERLLPNTEKCADSLQTESGCSSVVLPTDVETSDTENLRAELKVHGIFYGPLTATTKRLYQHQLHKKKKNLDVSCGRKENLYCQELKRTLGDKNPLFFISRGANLEKQVSEQFAQKRSQINWKEGNLKTSFTYLLLDPRITNNLPSQAANLSNKHVWALFLKSIFYIGKGKRSRPYAHLYEAVQKMKGENPRYASNKVKRIIEIWQEGLGVICLHVFQNVIPVEAYTREAAMIDAIGLQNLCNMKRSEYFGKAAQLYSQDQRILGIYLLYKSMQIFLLEGERHLSPWDITLRAD